MNQDEFEEFFRSSEVGLRRALISWYGPVVGRDATAAALSWAWENKDRLESIDNLPGYLFRVGQSNAKREFRRTRSWSLDEWALGSPDENFPFEPELLPALAALSDRQRSAVLMVHGYGYSFRDAADALNISLGTIRTHVDRALARLRSQLEVDDDATTV